MPTGNNSQQSTFNDNYGVSFDAGAMQESASGVFGTAYNAIFEYMQTTYGELLEALTNATSQTVVWADVLAEYQEYKTLLS